MDLQTSGVAESRQQTEDLDPAVLKEMAIKRKSAADSPQIENRKGYRITKTPVFIGVPRDDLTGAILFVRECPDYRQTARE